MARLLLLIAIWAASASVSFAKENYDISTPVGLPEEGINKVLCMKNGYTMLFHFEINKPIIVKVFDTAHKRVANTNVSCDMLDLSMLSTSVFKGLFEVNGEAVLFFEQQNTGKHSLIRLRFNATNGMLVNETTIGKSRGLAKPMTFHVLRHKREEGYAVLYCQDAPQFKESQIHLSYYNKLHEVYRDMPLDPERKKYDYIAVVGAEAQPEGICICFGLSTMLVNGTGTSTEATARYNHYLNIAYIPKDSTHAIQKTADLSTEIMPYYTNFTHNPFAGTINILMLSYRDALYRYGIEMRPTALVSSLLFKMDAQNLAGNYSWLTNKLANKLLAEQKDTTAFFSGLPAMMTTNSNGLSTVVSESYERYINTDNYARNPSFDTSLSNRGGLLANYNGGLNSNPLVNTNVLSSLNNNTRDRLYETYLGSFCITQFDDDGKEIWGTVLPRTQYYKSYRHYYKPADIAKRWQDQAMFNDLPPQISERQFLSANVYNYRDNFYIIYNDCGKNMHNTIQSPGDTVYTSALSNVCYYRMNRKKEITKDYLLGEPLIKEYKSAFIEGADFDEQRGVYASLIRYKRGEYVSMRMAWVTME